MRPQARADAGDRNDGQGAVRHAAPQDACEASLELVDAAYRRGIRSGQQRQVIAHEITALHDRGQALETARAGTTHFVHRGALRGREFRRQLAALRHRRGLLVVPQHHHRHLAMRREWQLPAHDLVVIELGDQRRVAEQLSIFVELIPEARHRRAQAGGAGIEVEVAAVQRSRQPLGGIAALRDGPRPGARAARAVPAPRDASPASDRRSSPGRAAAR